MLQLTEKKGIQLKHKLKIINKMIIQKEIIINFLNKMKAI